MTRDEHIAWCKDRAIREMDFSHDPRQGIISMMSDLRKHPETAGEALQALCGMTLFRTDLTRQSVVDFIKGFR